MTSDERREAAESLRDIDEAWPTLVDDLEEDPLRFGGLAMAGILACVDDRALFRRLADLIDPTCEIMRSVSFDKFGVCSACGALVNMMDSVANATNYLKPLYCPSCGARVVGR